MNFKLSLFKRALQGKEEDYTKVNLKTGIFLLAVPMILEMVMESLFALVDIFFVSKLGDYAIATVGLTEALISIVYSIGFGISMAATALIARRFGEKEYEKAGSTAFQLLTFGFVISLFISVGGYLFAHELLVLMGADNKVLEEGAEFTKIIFAGNTAIMLLFLINGIFRGAGQAHLAMKTLLISNGINLVLDPIFIFGLGSFEGFGLVGAAWATTIGRSMGVLFQLYHLFNGKHLLVIIRKNISMQWETIQKIISISSGGMGQFLIDSVAWISLARMMAEFGSVGVAGLTIAFRILIFTLMPAWGFSGAAATLVGQNLGAKKVKRAEISVWLTARYNFIFLALVTVLYLCFGNYLANLFAPQPEVATLAAKGLKTIVLGYIFFAVGMVMIQSFNGAGDSKTPLFINVFSFVLLEIPLAYFLAFTLHFREMGIFIAVASCHSLHALIAIYFFRKGKWKKVVV